MNIATKIETGKKKIKKKKKKDVTSWLDSVLLPRRAGSHGEARRFYRKAVNTFNEKKKQRVIICTRDWTSEEAKKFAEKKKGVGE